MIRISDIFDHGMRPVVAGGVLRMEADDGEKARRVAKRIQKALPTSSGIAAKAKEKSANRDAERTADAAKKAASDKVSTAVAKANTPAAKRRATLQKNQRKRMRDAISGLRAKRLAKKALNVSKPKSSAPQVNAQLAHCMLALHVKRGKDPRASWNICRASLTKYGYLKGPYREGGKLDTVKPTQRGTRRAMQHANEKHPLGGGISGTPAAKYAKFQKMFRIIEPEVT
jgi:hypothetical protein